MQDQVIGTNGQGALEFAAKGFDGFLQKQFVGAGEVHEIVGVDDERLEIVLGAQLQHLFAQRLTEVIGRPLTRAGGENLGRVASDAVGALGGVVYASGSGGVDADAAGSQAGRAFRSGTGEDILFVGEG